MTSRSKHFVAAAAALMALGSASLAGAQTNGDGHAFKATMSGPAETPAGDPHGKGTASLKLDAAKRQVCYDLQVSNIATATMAHIHKGAPGEAGPVVVPLKAPDKSGKSSGCAEADPTVISEIIHSPSAYYVNVHNAEFPGGAVRGQLTQ